MARDWRHLEVIQYLNGGRGDSLNKNISLCVVTIFIYIVHNDQVAVILLYVICEYPIYSLGGYILVSSSQYTLVSLV